MTPIAAAALAPSTFHAPAASPARAVVRVLVVDDEAPVRNAIAKLVGTRGYEVRTAESGAAALALLASDRFDLVVSDVRMPGMSGIELVPRALGADADLAMVMLSGADDAADATQALRGGAMDYLVKPVDAEALFAALARALDRRRLGVERRRVEQLVRDEVTLRTAELEREKEALRTLTVSVAETLINAMEAKDQYLRGHSVRVADLAAQVAEELGLDADAVEQVRLAGRLHDVGKIGIRESVLNKPGALTPEEYAHVKEHVPIGMAILAPLRHLGEVLEFVRAHHERWDGSGYPRGLRGEESPLGARIINACDAYDAMTSRRAYREPMSKETTIERLATEADRLVDRAVIDALRTVVTRRSSLEFLDDLPA
jgi:putative nucleotidyltransferase with HDIG domain